MLALIVTLAMLNSCIELELCAPSFIQAAQALGVDASAMSLTVTLNCLGFALGSFVFGPLSDRFGRRPAMIGGQLLVLIGALGASLSPDFQSLLCFRVLQGIGASSAPVIATIILSETYSKTKCERIYAWMNGFFIVTMAASPMIGGLVQQALGWRANYAILVGVALLSLLGVFLGLPETQTNPTRKSIDLKALANQASTLLTSITFVLTSIIPSLYYAVYLSFMAKSCELYLNEYGLGYSMYLRHIAGVIGVFALTSLLYPWLQKNLKPAQLYCLASIGLMGTLCLSWSTTPTQTSLAMMSFSLSFALIYPPLFALSMTWFKGYEGMAASMNMGLRYLLGALVSASTLSMGATLSFTHWLFFMGILIALLGVLLIQRLRVRPDHTPLSNPPHN